MKMKTTSILVLTAFALMSFTAAVMSDSYTILKEKSKIEWKGKKIGGEHVGIVELKSGTFTLEDDLITSGNFVIDMTTIKPTDTDSKKLENHIRSVDFFNVENYPESKLVITGSKALGEDKLEVTGKMTILGKTNDITFTAVNSGKTENFRIYAANITIDRTKYGITYKSSALGNATIYDDFDLKVKIVAKKD